MIHYASIRLVLIPLDARHSAGVENQERESSNVMLVGWSLSLMFPLSFSLQLMLE